ncbi:High temperature protein G [uncultured Ruminococcus sp.]|uniref:molecular chaperone HtpG n=1 Tax=Massiliimalia timonensis TaxID=1987501 RepID=UPI000820DAB4|nr:molecular chaperone HtpG [Massiliimalia timonensis]SCH42691.1 High temperature protein G [uncultured Ruminococcus sp.]SCI11567.1 High temperature protein G [uncultured Clostridium sp.]
MAKKQFKAESKRLLDLMIHSIYTHHEIFLRELISNASDAIDKLYFKSLTDHSISLSREDFKIHLSLDKENRTLTLSDNGIGMTQEELENNLGVIAKSGSLAFKKENDMQDDVDIIGQFGVGFYAAFMVSSEVKVVSRAYGSDDAYCWISSGVDGYTIEPCRKDSVGTDVILKIKENTEEENFDEFLEQYRIQGIVKKYSDYIRYPIQMEMERSKLKEGTGKDGVDPEYETYTETETLNSMVPIWKKSKEEVSEEDYNNFYKEKFFDFEDPLKVIHSKTEGAATYNALLFIPAKAPFNYYTKDFEKGLQLYSNGVLIMDKCADLLPDYFSFVKGLVDSEDLSLNISREMLQHDRQLKVIAKSIEKKIKNELAKLMKSDREAYNKFFENFGLQLKYGVYSNYGMNKEQLQDLLLFHSSSENKLVSLAEYVSRMKEEQKYIYYATGESVARIEHLPQAELVKDKGFEILYLTDDIDEFAIQMMREYQEKQFKSISAGDLDLETEEEKEEIKKQEEENKDLFAAMKEALGDKVSKVRLSQRLKSHPVCLTSEGGLSLEMEKVLNAMPTDQKVKAERVLEINAAHPIFETLKKLAATDPEKLNAYTDLLYTQAMLIEGMPVEDPVAFSNAVCDLMTQ